MVDQNHNQTRQLFTIRSSLQKQSPTVFSSEPVADPGFPRGGGANSQGGAPPTYDFVKFCRKLHENEEILAAGGGGGVPCGPP